jgi:ABC-type multidrug transport system ATPase subunit
MTTVTDIESDVDTIKKCSKVCAGQEKNNIFQFDITFTVPNPNGNKIIVSRASDLVTSGQTLAIMGPSGAGKTALLKALTMEAPGGTTSGTVTLNGVPLTASRFSQRCALVAQDEHHRAFLTCRETIACAAHPYMLGTREEKEREVDSMLKKTGLESCADTMVGNIFMKERLSGIQLRRLSLAVILMKKLGVVLFDEPTSGLDAASSADIINLISELTKSEGLITIYTVQQPATTIYNTFDRIMLLTDGKIAYSGTRENVLPYFELIGLPVPAPTNPAEFMLNQVNKDLSDVEHIDRVLDAWQKHGVAQHQRRIDDIMQTVLASTS